ncbi:MAG: hypothetical protein IIZ57_07245 [Solobacterium sp.]|nr:hypothetical protein [Solobacterium sp.]
MLMDQLDQFTEELHEWSLKGKEPRIASRDLRYFLDLQEKRLKRTDTVREEEYTHVNDEIRGCAYRNENGYSSRILYREAIQNISYHRNGKPVRKIRRPVDLYVTFTDKEGHEDREYKCPNCGHTLTALQAGDGCPYCGTYFETDDVYPCVSSYYTVSSIVERAGLMERMKKEMIIAGSIFGSFLFVTCLYVWSDVILIYRIIGALFFSGFCGGVAAFIWYMFRSFLMLGKLLREAGRAMPMMKTLRSREKMMKFMEPYDPEFSYEAFEGRVLSLLRTIVFSDDRESLSVWEGNRDLSSFDSIADMQYRGAVDIKKTEERDHQLRVEGTAYLTDTYIGRTVRERDEQIRFVIVKEAGSSAEPGFSIHRVSCPTCGGSFDAMHQSTCPYCGNPYDLKKKDWIIQDMRKA